MIQTIDGLELVRSNEKSLRGLPAAQDKDAFAYSAKLVAPVVGGPPAKFFVNQKWSVGIKLL
jgi:hypothetical protein